MKQGRPTLLTRKVCRGLKTETKARSMSLRALCAEKGLTYISVVVANKRYGLRSARAKKAKTA